MTRCLFQEMRRAMEGRGQEREKGESELADDQEEGRKRGEGEVEVSAVVH